jgi:hypothetical protein
MSCLGPNYNPNPPREWSRYKPRCLNNDDNAQMYIKANILQYKKNSSQLTKKQKYASLAQRKFTSWASQSSQSSFPNIKFLKRENQSYIVAPQSRNIIDSNNITSYELQDCIKNKINLPPIVDTPGVPIYLIPNGGRLICNTIENPCTGALLQKQANNICYPTTSSDVPGQIKLLCWSGILPTFFPKVRRTYKTGDNK